MFKGILPSKRISSSDFTMVTNMGDLTGKENLPGGPAPLATKGTRQALLATKGHSQSQEKKKKGDAKKGKEIKEQPADGAGMNMAFDRLLVSRKSCYNGQGLMTSLGRSSNSSYLETQTHRDGFHSQSCHAQVLADNGTQSSQTSIPAYDSPLCSPPQSAQHRILELSACKQTLHRL